MAELATLARPYAEALFEVAQNGDLKQAAAELETLATVAANPQLRQYADTPSSSPTQVYGLIVSVVGDALSEHSKNLLRALIDNGRLAVLPDIVTQFRSLMTERSGVADAKIYSAFPISATALAELMPALERRFKRRLDATVEVQPDLIGGIRAVVGDEVLDTSVRARLEQMKAALTA